jgi:hypothetical protein
LLQVFNIEVTSTFNVHQVPCLLPASTTSIFFIFYLFPKGDNFQKVTKSNHQFIIPSHPQNPIIKPFINLRVSDVKQCSRRLQTVAAVFQPLRAERTASCVT